MNLFDRIFRQGHNPTLRLFVPLSLERCITRMQNLDEDNVQFEERLDTKLEQYDEDRYDYMISIEELDAGRWYTSTTGVVGYMKRWDDVSTLLVAYLRVPSAMLTIRIVTMVAIVSTTMLFVARGVVVDEGDFLPEMLVYLGILLVSVVVFLFPRLIRRTHPDEALLLDVLYKKFGEQHFEDVEDDPFI